MLLGLIITFDYENGGPSNLKQLHMEIYCYNGIRYLTYIFKCCLICKEKGRKYGIGHVHIWI